MENTFGKNNKKKRVASMKLSKLKKSKKNQVEDRVDTVRKRKRSAGRELNKSMKLSKLKKSKKNEVEDSVDTVRERKRSAGRELDKRNILRVKQHVEAFQKKSIFFELEYWKYLLVRHMLDVMHIEKNVSESIIGTILDVAGKSKDGLNSRLDLKDMGIKEELQTHDLENGTYLPPACFKLSKDEKIKFCKTLSLLKVPSGYSSSLRNCVSMDDLKLQGLKSHDFHVLMQQLLPVAIRSILPNKVRYVIIRLCFFFKALCSKEVDASKLDDMQKKLVETLFLLEKYFPPLFFDIMIHLTVHLVREVRLCGPVYFLWMYPFERFLKFLKSNIRNKNRPGGCIAENYTAYEGAEHCAEKFPGKKSTGIPLTGNLVTEGKPFPGGVPIRVDYELWAQAHRTILANTDEVQPYAERHILSLNNEYPRQSRSLKWLHDKHNDTFINWLKEKVEDELNEPNNNISNKLEWIAHGPCQEVYKYSGYDINGYRYHTKELDDKRVNQNSGVSIFASGMQGCSAKDINSVFDPFTYYGVINEIWLLDYNTRRIPVFKCDWVDSVRGISTDDLGFKSVELSRRGHKSDPFILASQAKQVFYVEDQLDSTLSVVLTMPSKEDPCLGTDMLELVASLMLILERRNLLCV